jgi:hypothetical protein
VTSDLSSSLGIETIDSVENLVVVESTSSLTVDNDGRFFTPGSFYSVVVDFLFDNLFLSFGIDFISFLFNPLFFDWFIWDIGVDEISDFSQFFFNLQQ